MTPYERARLSLDGLSIGDAFGERFFGDIVEVTDRIERRDVPPGIWRYTDDSQMAIVLLEILEECGEVDQDKLAKRFAERMEPWRGYGAGAFELLSQVREGGDWSRLSKASFGGTGSFGNGAAMRVAPLGAFLADADLEYLVRQATSSAEVTHSHPEGIAGAVAVAVAAGLAWRAYGSSHPLGPEWIKRVSDATPPGYTKDAIAGALALPSDTNVRDAARVLGNGSRVSAPDTVPLCLWIAAKYSNDYCEAIWQTVSALGDRDTTCAIVGGIVALQAGRRSIPTEWLNARETLERTDS